MSTLNDILPSGSGQSCRPGNAAEPSLLESRAPDWWRNRCKLALISVLGFFAASFFAVVLGPALPKFALLMAIVAAVAVFALAALGIATAALTCWRWRRLPPAERAVSGAVVLVSLALPALAGAVVWAIFASFSM
jgi:hypothetical protein